MKILAQFLLLVVVAASLCGCFFKEPVFTEGFAKVDQTLGGVWAMEEDDDPRKTELAVCAPLDAERMLVHYPGGKEGMYYEAQSVKVRDRSVIQLRMLATSSGGVAKADSARYTLLWVEKRGDASKLRVRALGGDAAEGKSPADVKRLLEDPASDWEKLFGKATDFRRLKDN